MLQREDVGFDRSLTGKPQFEQRFLSVEVGAHRSVRGLVAVHRVAAGWNGPDVGIHRHLDVFQPVRAVGLLDERIVRIPGKNHAVRAHLFARCGIDAYTQFREALRRRRPQRERDVVGDSRIERVGQREHASPFGVGIEDVDLLAGPVHGDVEHEVVAERVRGDGGHAGNLYDRIRNEH